MIKLAENEQIFLKVRKHWILLLSQSAFLLLFLTLPFILYAATHFLGIEQTIHIAGDMTALIIFLSGLWLLFVWVSFFLIWTDYYLDILILTDKHIIDIQQKGLFNRELSTSRLDRVQDITIEMNGIIETFFDYGTIHIQTAGEQREFIMVGIPAPFEIKRIISDQQNLAVNKLRTMNISDESLNKLRRR